MYYKIQLLLIKDIDYRSYLKKFFNVILNEIPMLL